MGIEESRTPTFPFAVSSGYQWLVDRGLAGFDPFSALQPWHLLARAEAFSVSTRWPRAGATGEEVVAFARRQDCDDLACFLRGYDGVLVIHGWTPGGYDVVARYASFWDWLKSVVDDIREWAALTDPHSP